MPDLSVQSGGLDFADNDVVSFLEQRNPLGRDLAQNPHGQPGAGEGLALQDFFRHAKIAPDAPHLVLKEVLERLDQFELHVRGQAADVVVALDGGRRSAHRLRLDDVGIERALHQELGAAHGHIAGDDLGRLVVEHGDEFRADDLALLLRLGDARQLVEEAPGRVHGDDVESKLLAQRPLDFLELVLAQHAVVDENASQPFADGARYQRRRDRRIHAAGERANGVSAFADGLLDLLDGFVNKPLWRPIWPGLADAENEILQHFRAQGGVMNFGMELHRPVAALRVFHRRESICRAPHRLKTGGQFARFVTVGHPDLDFAGQSAEEPGVAGNRYLRMAVLARLAGDDFAAELVGHPMQAVANAQHGQAKVKDALVSQGRIGVVYRARTAGQNDAHGLIRLDFVEGRGAGKDDGEDVLLADAARDELRELRAEVEDDDGLVFHGLD